MNSTAAILSDHIELEELAKKRFGSLSVAETNVVCAVPKGEIAYCGPNHQNDASTNDPANSHQWPLGRHIRAELIRWLCVDHEAKSFIDPKGIHVHGARITGSLDLSFVTVIFPLRFVCCCLPEHFDLTCSELALIELTRSWLQSLSVARATVKGSISVKDSSYVRGLLNLCGVQIRGDLDCSGGKFKNPAKPDALGRVIALNARSARVSGSILLREDFEAEGEVSLYAAVVDGNLDCNGGAFKNLGSRTFPWSGIALNATSIRVGGAVFFTNKFSAMGAVWLVRAQIGGHLECHGSEFCVQSELSSATETPDMLPTQSLCSEVLPAKVALCADSAKVDGHVFLQGTFCAEIAVHLYRMEVGGTLNCVGAKFKFPTKCDSNGSALHANGSALHAALVKVGGDVLLSQGFSADGLISLSGARIGGSLECQRANINRLNLTGASANSIRDAVDSWPRELVLDGFVYETIADGPADAQSRLQWLSRQVSFTRQPYRQLSKILRNAGDESGWRAVCIEMESRIRQVQPSLSTNVHSRANRWAKHIRNAVLKSTIGYGYSSLKVVPWFLLLVMVGFVLYWCAYDVGSLIPNQEKPYDSFKVNCTVPEYYERFHALAYSFENSFPLIKLGIQEKWGPAPNAQISSCVSVDGASRVLSRVFSPALMRVCRWLQILVGWVLTTLFVAGLTGIVRKD